MQLPLSLTTRPSKYLFLLLTSGYIITGVAVFVLAWPIWLMGLVLLVLVALGGRQLYLLKQNTDRFELLDDGELLWFSGETAQRAQVGSDTVLSPWMVILHCQLEDETRLSRVLLPDVFADPDAHRQLRLWLRWRATLV